MFEHCSKCYIPEPTYPKNLPKEARRAWTVHQDSIREIIRADYCWKTRWNHITEYGVNIDFDYEYINPQNAYECEEHTRIVLNDILKKYGLKCKPVYKNNKIIGDKLC